MNDAAKKLTTPKPANDNAVPLDEREAVECPECKATGTVSRKLRPIDGHGFRVELDDCANCDGAGYVLAGSLHDCPACDGAGVTWDEYGSVCTACPHCAEGLVTFDQWQDVDAWLVNEFG